MGCDIHLVLERRTERGWLGMWSSDCMPGGRPKFAARDYSLFAYFGVRGRADEGVIWPRNLPEDVSALAWKMFYRAPRDYHSASYCTLAEFYTAWRKANPDSTEVRDDFWQWDLFAIDSSDDRPAEHRLVFWFDN